MKLVVFGELYWVTDMKIAGKHHSILIAPCEPATIQAQSAAPGVSLPSNWVFVGLINQESF